MEFCPECGSMMMPDEDGILTCNSCGHSDANTNTADYEGISIGEHESEDTVKMLGEDVDLGPGVTEICPKCGHDKATYELKQTRSADEAPTRFFTCKKCKHKWREYD